MSATEIDLTVYPDECDAFGHLNQASFLSLFERARWEMLARGPGMDVFTRQGAWPAVRRTAIDYHAPAFPGDVLRFQQALTHHGRTSFTMRQTARRITDDRLIATAEFVFVCIDRSGRPTPVPSEVGTFMVTRPAEPPGVQRITVNGVSLAVEMRGSGTAVLFIHGYPLDRTMWAAQVAGLDNCRRIAPDLRGFGLSDAPDLGYGMHTYADDLAAILDAQQVDEAVLVGLSMGGYVAFEFIRRHRERVKALILIDTRAEADTPEQRKARDQSASLAREHGAAAITEKMLPKLIAPQNGKAMPHLVERLKAMMQAAPVSGIVGALSAMRDRLDSTLLLSALEGMPTLIIVGEHDEITPVASAEAMKAALPSAELKVVPGAGHMSPMEKPEAVNALLADFLKRLPG
jgi:YbgC/YbaW family acyl-CoA thioester hydrolase